MKSRIVNVSLLALATLFLFIGAVFAQEPDFVRWDDMEIPVPDADLNTGGIGNMVTNVDIDQDGRTDVYVVNHNWSDAENELLPRLYKYEYNGTNWEVVWKATFDVWKSNTWPALTIGDLDSDGKKELIFGPVNWTDGTENPNPVRVLVYETAGDGSDVMGVADGDNFKPNASSTITSEDGVNLRPFRWVVSDVDGDGVNELVFSDRYGNTSGWYFGVLSVSDVPDDANATETWTVEANGLTLGLEGAENKWDVAVLGNTIYLFDETRCDRVRATAADTYELLSPQTSVLKGAGSWKSSQVLDIDNNATEEIIAGTWYTTADGGHGVWVMEYDETGDSLVSTKVADLSPWMEGYGVYGGTIGDIDLDGGIDYVFGSRDASPNAAILRLEYVGAQDGVADPENWELSAIDSNYAEGGRWGVLGMANIDDDPNLEVLYTSSVPAGGIFGGPQPIVVLDNTAEVLTGPYQKTDVPYVFKEVFQDGLKAPHGIAVDKYGRVWEAGYLDPQLHIFNADGSEADISPIDSVVVPNPIGGDTTIAIKSSRGLAVDQDGNIIFVRNAVAILIDVDTGEGIDFLKLAGSPLKPAVDDAGFIYIGYVVGVSPIEVIDPDGFDFSTQIVLDGAPGFARGMDVSPDGLMLLPGNLDNAAHSNPLFTSTDYQNYTKTDSIYTDNMGMPIFTKQSVTVDRKGDGTFWYSQDNSYGAAGEDQMDNALVMIDMTEGAEKYGYLYMPEPRTDLNGPRGAAFHGDNGDTIYVASSNGGAIFKYVHEDHMALEDGRQFGTVSGFELAQNYPNPFNPTTDIKFTVGKAGKVSLKVYNMLGQEVATLVNSRMPMGNFKITFDGSKLATGMYVYVMKSNGISISKKMMLVK